MMATWPQNPAIYEINAWTWLHELRAQAGAPLTLAEIPQAELERLAGYGFDALWLMGVWQRSPAGRAVAVAHPGLQQEYARALPDFGATDVVGSPYCIFDYTVDAALGGDAALAVLRSRMAALGLRLILDFVPNHLARDHAWLGEHPERLLQGDADSLARQPANYFDHVANGQWRVFAHGRDPYFDGWSDTVQVDYRLPASRRAMTDALLAVAERCDGARCDMAMLVNRDIFLRTWGGEFVPPRTEFWPAAITDVRAAYPDFLLLAEVYWDLEWELQQLGFDYTYDKRLYDRLVQGDAIEVQLHLAADTGYQRHMARFIENHDERRAVAAFGIARSMAAAVLAYTTPGLRLFHEGQLVGRRIKLPVQLGRRPLEQDDSTLEQLYRRLLDALRAPVMHHGDWQVLPPTAEWPGNTSYRQVVAFAWGLGNERRLVVVNLSPEPAQALLPVPWVALAGHTWRLNDLLNDNSYLRRGDDMLGAGLYVDLPGYGYHLFAIEAVTSNL
ncbi:MAG: alpha-amylase family glycosyl hydrolase [Caldilineales bacterium]